MALAETLKLRGRNREVESSLPCLAAAAPGNGNLILLMAANSKKVINFLSAGRWPAASITAITTALRWRPSPRRHRARRRLVQRRMAEDGAARARNDSCGEHQSGFRA